MQARVDKVNATSSQGALVHDLLSRRDIRLAKMLGPVSHLSEMINTVTIRIQMNPGPTDVTCSNRGADAHGGPSPVRQRLVGGMDLPHLIGVGALPLVIGEAR